MAAAACPPCKSRATASLPMAGAGPPTSSDFEPRPIVRGWRHLHRLPLPCAEPAGRCHPCVNSLSTSLSPALLPPAMGLLVLLLGAYVCIDMGQRVRQRAAAERLPWLLASGVALATGPVGHRRAGRGRPVVRAGHRLRSAQRRRCRAASPCAGPARPAPERCLRRPRARAGWAAQRCWAARHWPRRCWQLSSVAQPAGVHWNIGLLLLAWLSASSGFGWGLRAACMPSQAEPSPRRQGVAALVLARARWSPTRWRWPRPALPATATPLSDDAIAAGRR